MYKVHLAQQKERKKGMKTGNGKTVARAGNGRFKGGGLLAEECRRSDASELARLRVLVEEQDKELEAHRQAVGDLKKQVDLLLGQHTTECNRTFMATNRADVYRRALEAQSEAVLRLAELGA